MTTWTRRQDTAGQASAVCCRFTTQIYLNQSQQMLGRTRDSSASELRIAEALRKYCCVERSGQHATFLEFLHAILFKHCAIERLFTKSLNRCVYSESKPRSEIIAVWAESDCARAQGHGSNDAVKAARKTAQTEPFSTFGTAQISTRSGEAIDFRGRPRTGGRHHP